MTWLALDIGGANLKIADGRRVAVSQEFPLWQKPQELPAALSTLIEKAPAAERFAVTMTGELADCFETKAEGVRAILSAVEQTVGQCPVFVYLCDGRLVSPDEARAETALTAASNWHALASYCARYCEGSSGLLFDIGSTTTDIIPLENSGPVLQGLTDTDRLISGELVYTGVVRSPVCAVVDEITWRDKPCPVAQELFATMVDVYLLLGNLPEDPGSTQTADDRPQTKEYAHARLARSICAEPSIFSQEDATRSAEIIRDSQLALLESAFQKVVLHSGKTPLMAILSGQGEFLARQLFDRLGFRGNVISLSEQLGVGVSQCACAHALAVLARERFPE